MLILSISLLSIGIGGSIGVLGAAMALGIRHGIDWDHIAAITDITSTAATIDDDNYQGTISDTLLVTITGIVRHAPVLNGDVEGSLQVLLPESLTLNSGAMVSADVLVSGTVEGSVFIG